jgi:hypothetical protein
MRAALTIPTLEAAEQILRFARITKTGDPGLGDEKGQNLVGSVK